MVRGNCNFLSNQKIDHSIKHEPGFQLQCNQVGHFLLDELIDLRTERFESVKSEDQLLVTQQGLLVVFSGLHVLGIFFELPAHVIDIELTKLLRGIEFLRGVSHWR